MPRPIKMGLDYFPFDVGFFEDKKIRALKGKYGSNGVLSYIYVLCRIYEDKGYYVELDEDFILCMSDDLNITEESTMQILKYLLSRSLLCEIKDSTLAKSVTIITAKSIQRRYQEAKKGLKRDVFVKAKYWVLEKLETLSFIKVRPDEDKSEKNNSKSEKNNNKSAIYDTKESKEKESKEKKSKGEKSRFASPLLTYGEFGNIKLTESEYQKLTEQYGKQNLDKYIKKMDVYLQEKGRTYNNYYLALIKWLDADNVKKEFSDGFDADKYKSLINNF